jgi:cell division protein FtsL
LAWVNDLSKNINENKRRLDDLESEVEDLKHRFEDALGARR